MICQHVFKRRGTIKVDTTKKTHRWKRCVKCGVSKERVSK